MSPSIFDQSGLFRKKSYERLTSPDKLDELLKVTSSKNWLILLAFILVIIIVLLWSFMGSIIIKADGQGIINQPDLEITCLYNGIIDTIFVQPGFTVTKDQVLARIIPDEAMKNISGYYSGIHSLEAQNNSDNNKRISELQTQLCQYRAELRDQGLVLSAGSGTITEIKATAGSHVEANSPFASIQKRSTDPVPPVIFFIESAEINSIKPGMEVQIKVSDAYGSNTLPGRVVYISQFPATYDRLIRIFQNETIAQRLAKTTCYELKAAIIPSRQLPAKKLNQSNGRLCQVTVIIGRKKPISLFF